MNAYRYQELAYLIIPVLLGLEFFISAKDEKKEKEETPLGSYMLDFFGFLFMALIPAIFIFTIWAVETKAFPVQDMSLARLDRYAVLFFFMGSWWQVHMIGALRARRLGEKNAGKWYALAPYLILGIFISFLILWVSPFHLKWVSVIWFFMVFGILRVSKARAKTMERVFWVLTVFFFILENVMFIFLETVV
ncbi:MAG: hypothetical protein M1508_07700 [Nitrospirae bacterium]|nr:hypothetical protein [Nitrospirota bacterium]MCL5421284.1 hypothetical protein [Nitrospirota bacterium]